MQPITSAKSYAELEQERSDALHELAKACEVIKRASKFHGFIRSEFYWEWVGKDYKTIMDDLNNTLEHCQLKYEKGRLRCL